MKDTANYKDEESFCSFVSWLLLWHWLSVENIDRKTRTAVRMIITKAQLMSVRCFVINFLRADVFLKDTINCIYLLLRDNKKHMGPEDNFCLTKISKESVFSQVDVRIPNM